MANTGFYGSSIMNPEWWKPIIQDYLNNMLISLDICNTKCESYLSSGRRVHFPYVSDVRVQSYTPGTGLTIDGLTATDDYLTVDQSKVATFAADPIEIKQALAPYVSQLAYQSAFELKNNVDQTVIGGAITNASTTTTAGSVSTSNLFSTFANARAQLGMNNALDADTFAVIDYPRLELLSQTFVANGFNEADLNLRRSFTGDCLGFHVYVTNNLPYTAAYTMDTINTAGKTFTIKGITFTFVASGTATNPGDISIGINVAANQANFLLAINGTGTPGTGTYIDVSVENRRTLQNAQVNASAFQTNVSTLTGFGKLSASTNSADGANGVGTETTKMLFGRMGAPSLAIQMQPELYVHPIADQLGNNYMTSILYGTKVFFRDTKRLTTVGINA